MYLVQISWGPFTSFSIWIRHLSQPLPPFYFPTDKSVWQVPGSIIGMRAHDWKELDFFIFANANALKSETDLTIFSDLITVHTNYKVFLLKFNPLSPNIHIQILQTDLLTFPLRIS